MPVLSIQNFTISLWNRQAKIVTHHAMDVIKTFGINVRNERRARGWSQETLATKTDLHPTYVSGIENGDRNPSIKIIEKMARAFEVQPCELLK